MKIFKTYTLPILYDFEYNKHYIELTREIITESRFRINDTLQWKIDGDEVIIRKGSSSNPVQLDFSYYGC
jgi:uncharacterized lipoprotein YbaY